MVERPTEPAADPVGEWLRPLGIPVDFAGPTEPFDLIEGQWLARPLLDRLHHIAQLYPDKVAVDDGRETLTFAEWLGASEHLAERIRVSTPHDRPVATLVFDSIDAAVVCVALMISGRAMVAIDAGDTSARQLTILEQARPSVLVVGSRTEPTITADGLPWLTFDARDTGGDRFGGDPPPRNSIAAISFTSGSLASPKGIAQSHGAIIGLIVDYANAFHLGPSDRILALASLAVGGVRDILAAALTGATVRLLSIKSQGLNECLRVLGEERITVLTFVPTALRMIFNVPGAEQAFHALRLMELFGERTSAADIRLFRSKLPSDCKICTGMGSTEAFMMFHWFVRDDALTGEIVPVGYLLPNQSVRLVDEMGLAAAPGEEGELIVRSERVALGLWKDGELSLAPFEQDADDPDVRIYRTGDLVRIGSDGLARYVGRRDQVVKIRGLRADLGEVEVALREAAAVADVAVVAASDADGDRIVAFIVGKEAAPDERVLRRLVAERCAPHMAPSEIRFLPAIPRLGNLKPDIKALVQLVQRATD